MQAKLTPVTVILILFTIVAKAQYIDLIGASEKEIKEKIKGFDTVEKIQIRDHELYDLLVLDDKENGNSSSFYFFPGIDKCYQIMYKAPVRFLNAYLKLANSRFKNVGENRWENNEGTIGILITHTEERVGMLYYQISKML